MATLELTRATQMDVESLHVAEIDPLSAFDFVLNSDPEGIPTLVGADGQRAAFPIVLLDILRNSVRLLKAHYGVTVIATNNYLTTQEAANLLGVSRPTLVGLLESGQISFDKVGNRRRVQVQALEAYQALRETEQRNKLDRLFARGNRATMYEEDF